MARMTCSVYAPEVYICVWLISVTRMPSLASASRSGSLKCSAQFSWQSPAGSGTDVSGRPMCSARLTGNPAGTRRNRS